MSELPYKETRTALPPETFVHRGHNVTVSRVHCIDAMGPDSNGFYEFYYDYTVFDFEAGDDGVSAKQYTESPELAALIRLTIEGRERLIRRSDFDLPVMTGAVGYFRARGASELTFLDEENDISGYSAVPV